MASKINLLIINCRDFNFPHAGNVDVKLLRVKHSIKIKVITYLAKKLSTRTDYYIAHTETYVWEHITNSGVEILYDNILTSLNYTDKFIAHYGYSDGDVAGTYGLGHGDYLSWFTDTLFSFEREIPIDVSDHFIDAVGRVRTDKRTMFGGRATVDTVMGVDVGKGVDKSVVTTVRGGREPLKELKVSPLAKSSMLDKFLGAKSFEGKIHLSPEQVEEMKKFGR